MAPRSLGSLFRPPRIEFGSMLRLIVRPWCLSLSLLVCRVVSTRCFTASSDLVPASSCGSVLRLATSRARQARIHRRASEADADVQSLRHRIAEVQELEVARETRLQQRIAEVRAADAAEAALYVQGGVVMMPVVCYDGMLPRQRLALDTEDPTFSRFLCELGLGGLFVMVAFDHKRRKVRRHGSMVRITNVDAVRGARVPTAVHASLVGRARARLLGPATDMAVRIGRYRREYHEYGEARALGWGVERFVDATPVHAAELEKLWVPASPESRDRPAPNAWTDAAVQLLFEPDECTPGCEDEAPSAETRLVAATEEKALGEELATLLERWLQLARDPRTYDNVNVTAAARARHGYPGLRVDPTRLVDSVLDDLGPMPPSYAPTALALWAAALVNPLPPLGVSPEMRAAVLEAPTSIRRLEMVRNGVRRSVLNLEGKMPLC
mmetsp:Transcript_79672/g.221703  ORF Transcript_79672/g.221703 Transcript_79672/m.221703 type:complete len:440 (-) Transcript_79672:7-1326(-)